MPVQAPARSSVREARQLSEAVTHLFDDITRAQVRTQAALKSARIFAASAAHELRTPPTTMRTDLEVVRGLDLSRSQIRDAATDTRRRNPDVAIEVRSAGPVLFDCLPSGIRLTIGNAIANAIKHGHATTVLIGAEHVQGRLSVTVDDNGTGIPGNERDAVFRRFYRGTNAADDGSGLGLALVAQLAEIHNGRACFTDSALGGIRLLSTSRLRYRFTVRSAVVVSGMISLMASTVLKTGMVRAAARYGVPSV
ncbi:HAMP domain-containing sensor histidine kinase [Nocardia sp. NPDC049220]|uniref:sensor histidine kinase n=1 Tax=Nocardia sp. NPDC049220 TaxID=3155273 RepID=UPI0033D8B293